MFSVELSEEEKLILAEVLDRSLKDLSYEIANTDDHDFRENLKNRREVIRRVHSALTNQDA